MYAANQEKEGEYEVFAENSGWASKPDQEPCCQNNNKYPAKIFRNLSKLSPGYSCHVGKGNGNEGVADVKNWLNDL